MSNNKCQLCGAEGRDKRTLRISCLYAVDEMIPEAIREDGCYRLLICKCCRAAFLGRLREWRKERVLLRSLPKDHDGYIDDEYILHIQGNEVANIPVRIDGAITMMTEREYNLYKTDQGR